jgi:UDP-N-acetylmuramoyl-tripeptide--D-alanyl-D-alanine ligase
MAKNLLTLSQLIAASGGFLSGSEKEITFSGVVYDSRQVEPGNLFVALPGETSDGHLYISAALQRGAAALLVEQKWLASQPDSLALPCPVVAVPDTLPAFQAVAAWWRTQLPNLKVTGITGSVGKTSTKELTAAVLSQRYRTFKSPKSFNNETSLMPVLLELQSEAEQAVLEMGCGWGFGELTRLCRVARPDCGVILNVSHSHLSRMGSLENIARAKAELIESLPADGWAVLNGDDRRVKALTGFTQARPFFYGTDSTCDLWADQLESFGLQGIAFTAHYRGTSQRLQLPLPGKHNLYNALAASAVGLLRGLTWAEIEAGLQDRTTQVRLVTRPGPSGSTILDDCYNASAVSTLAALELLAETPATGRKLALLGDMLELGEFTTEAHRQVGTRAAQVVDYLIVYGELAQLIAEAAQQNGLPENRIYFAKTKQQAVEWLTQTLQAGDLLLVKASRGIALETVIEQLTTF